MALSKEELAKQEEVAKKEEFARQETALLAEEHQIKKKWCKLKGHRWDLPSVSPFNHDMLVCLIICNRCNAHADLLITVRAEDKP
jgi:hypothetical protein